MRYLYSNIEESSDDNHSHFKNRYGSRRMSQKSL